MAAEYELTLNDYLAILRRRGKHIAVTFFLILVATIVVAVAIPPVYQSTGTILVESQQIPTDLVKAAVTTFADERIEVIKQRVITHENLLRIVDKYGMYKDDRKSKTTSEVIDEMRESIGVELLSAEQGQRGKGTTIAFKVSFEYRYPDIAHKVANELVTLFLDENVKARTERATETTEFLTQEADRLKAELEKVEDQVATYKQQHGDALPEHQELHMSMMQRVETTLKEVERDYKTTQEELRFLDVELAAAKAVAVAKPAQASIATPPVALTELDKLKTEYAKTVAVYKENHPTARALKRKIENLEKSEPEAPTALVVDDKAKSVEQVEAELRVAKVQAQIEAGRARLESLSQQTVALRAKLGQLEREIMQSPQVERGLTTLMRDYENAKAKYEEVSSKQSNARMAQNLEQENKAERFALLQPPLLPDKPIKPDRKKIIVMGFFLALAGAGGIVMALESLDKRVRGVEALTSLMGMRPLVAIPYITTQAEVARRKHLARYIVIALAILLVLILAAVHFLVLPLDILMMKLLARFE